MSKKNTGLIVVGGLAALLLLGGGGSGSGSGGSRFGGGGGGSFGGGSPVVEETPTDTPLVRPVGPQRQQYPNPLGQTLFVMGPGGTPLVERLDPETGLGTGQSLQETQFPFFSRERATDKTVQRLTRSGARFTADGGIDLSGFNVPISQKDKDRGLQGEANRRAAQQIQAVHKVRIAHAEVAERGGSAREMVQAGEQVLRDISKQREAEVSKRVDDFLKTYKPGSTKPPVSQNRIPHGSAPGGAFQTDPDDRVRSPKSVQTPRKVVNPHEATRQTVKHGSAPGGTFYIDPDDL